MLKMTQLYMTCRYMYIQSHKAYNFTSTEGLNCLPFDLFFSLRSLSSEINFFNWFVSGSDKVSPKQSDSISYSISWWKSSEKDDT